MKRKGFTLIELLAVIVILSVITLITVPMITNVIEESKKKALVSSVQGLIESANLYAIENEGVYEFLFDREHQGSTVKGEELDYKGSIDGEGKLYIDKEGNTSICISNDKYYVYKNYNSDILVGERNSGNCIIGFDALTNKYIAMLDDGTGQVSNVYSKDEVNNIVDGKTTELNHKIETNISEINNIKKNIEELQTNLSNYASQSELDKTNDNLNILSSLISGNKENISNLNSKIGSIQFHYYGGISTGDLIQIIDSYEYGVGYVYAQSGGFTLQNWPGNFDGIIIRFSNFILAVNGWNNDLYFNMKWGNSWHSWRKITAT